MSKAEVIRLLYSERCSISEIALAVGYAEWIVKTRIIRDKVHGRIPRAFNGWRGVPLSDKVVSF